MTDRRAFHGLLVCLLLSGMSGLIYEVAWVRSLDLIFGATTFAVATVLAAFMGGLAAGSGLAGAFSERLKRHHPLRVYALFEVLIALSALGVPPALRLLVPLSRGVWNAFQASFAVFSVMRFLLCVAVLLVPTALMGATLPVVSRFAGGAGGRAGVRGERDREAARRVGLLFAVNTAGAVAGCAAAGLALLPALGLLGTQRLAVVLNLMAAAGAFAIAARYPFALPGAAGDMAPAEAGRSGPPEPAPALAGFLVGTYAISGGVAMLYEVAWSRFLVLVLGSSTYSYTAMLTTFLVGLALGAWVASLLVPARADPILAVGLVQLLTAITTALGLFVAGELPYLYVRIHDLLHASPQGLLGVQLLLAGAVMILPTVGLGAMFPLTIAGLSPSGEHATRLVARAYAWNTLGAIIGSVVAGFWLLPAFGARNALLSGALINTALAVCGLLLAPPPALAYRRRTALLGIAALFVGILVLAAPAWRVEVLSSGIFRDTERYQGLGRSAFYERLRQSHGEFLFFDEGLTSTVGVFRTTRSLTLQVNGKPEASVPPGLPEPVPTGAPTLLGDLPTQVMVAQLPLLVAKRIDDVLVIGLGSGVTLGSVMTHRVKQVDCLELEDAVVQASRHFDAHSGAPLQDPRVSLIVNDARNDLLVRDRTYDVIISEPSNPWIPGAATLFTRDFFRVARGRLRPDGLFCQWIQLYELWPEDFMVILRSFQEVFPSIQIWTVGADAILLGGATEVALPVGQMFGRASERVRSDLSRIGIQGPADLLARFWIGGEELRQAVTPGPINTDDNMRIEFAAPLRMLSRDPARLERQRQGLMEMFRGRTTGVLPLLRLPEADPSRQALLLTQLSTAALARGFPDVAAAYAAAAWRLDPQPDSARARAAALAAAGRDEEARDARDQAMRAYPADPEIRRLLLDAAVRAGDRETVRSQAQALLALRTDDPVARFRLAEVQAATGEAGAALRTLEPLGPRYSAAEGPPDADVGSDALDGAGLLLGRLLIEAGRGGQAPGPLRAHLAKHADDREAQALLARALRAAGRQEEALALERRLQPDAAAQAEQRFQAAVLSLESDRLQESRAALEEALAFVPGHDRSAFLLARVRRRQGDRAGAIQVIETFLHARPDTPWALGYLGQLLAESGQRERAAAAAARHRALVGGDWESVD